MLKQVPAGLGALVFASFSIACGPDPAPTPAPVTTAIASASASAAVSADAGVDVHTRASPKHADVPPEPVEPVIAAGSVDGAKLRAKIKKRLTEDKSPVVLLTGDSPRALGEKLCQKVVPRRAKSTPILVKPNIGGFDWFKEAAENDGDDGFTGRTTNPEFVRGVITCLKTRGHENITIADGWGAAPKHWAMLMDKTGYGALAKELNVKMVALADDGHFDKIEGTPGKPLKVTGMERTRVPNLLMPQLLAEHLERGLVISVPKLKAHRFAVMSGGIKGMQGTVMLNNAKPAYQQKWRMHAELQDVLDLKKARDPKMARAYVDALNAFAARLTDVLLVEAADVVLMDAAPAMNGDGFHKLVPTPEMMAVGGTNPVAVDRVGAEILGLWKNRRLKTLLTHGTSPIITRAAKAIDLDLDAVEVTGNGKELLAGRRATHFVSMGGFEIHADAVPPRIAHAAHIADDTAVKIDGRIDEAAWGRATSVAFQTNFANKGVGIATRARFLWSSSALYVSWELDKTDLNTDRARPTSSERDKLYEEDCVEMFLDPTPNTPKQYLEFQIGPFGHFHDLGVDLSTKAFDADWNGHLQVAATQDEGARTATIEVAIRAPAVKLALTAGNRLPMGLFRMEGKAPRRYLVWSPAEQKRPNFHVPPAFGSLVLDE